MASEPIEPCPFCKSRCELEACCNGVVVVKCLYCEYTSNGNVNAELVVKQHNRVSRACQEYDKSRENEVGVKNA